MYGNNLLCIVILIGGEYQIESEACVGPLARLCLSQYFTDKCFFGFDGFDPNVGFTGSNPGRAEIVGVMKNQCTKMIALSPSDKFFATRIGSIGFPERSKYPSNR